MAKTRHKQRSLKCQTPVSTNPSTLTLSLILQHHLTFSFIPVIITTASAGHLLRKHISHTISHMMQLQKRPTGLFL